MNFSVSFKVQDVSDAVEDDLGPRDVMAVVVEQHEQPFLGSMNLQFAPGAEVPEVGDTIVATLSVLQPNGMPKTSGLEGIERQSVTG
jgi:hypothetical protein